MRFLTTTILFALTSTIAVSALPTGSSSSIYDRTDDLTSRPAGFEPLEAEEEQEAEEQDDVTQLLKRDLELELAHKRAVVSEEDAALAAQIAEDIEGEESPSWTKRDTNNSPEIDLAQADADEEAEDAEEQEEAEDEEMRKRDVQVQKLSAAELAAADEVEEDEEGDC